MPLVSREKAGGTGQTATYRIVGFEDPTRHILFSRVVVGHGGGQSSALSSVVVVLAAHARSVIRTKFSPSRQKTGMGMLVCINAVLVLLLYASMMDAPTRPGCYGVGQFGAVSNAIKRGILSQNCSPERRDSPAPSFIFLLQTGNFFRHPYTVS